MRWRALLCAWVAVTVAARRLDGMCMHELVRPCPSRSLPNFSIEVTNGDAVEHMHLMPHDGTAMVSDVRPGSLSAPAMSHTFELSDADSAMEHMRGQWGIRVTIVRCPIAA